MIEFVWEDISPLSLKSSKIEKWLNIIIDSYDNICGDLCFVFCSDNYLLEINKRYLRHDYFTDVITFNYCNGNILSGDIFISIDRVEDNAKNLGFLFENELMRVIVHGVLHLLGYDDKCEDDKLKMTSKEDEFLNRYFDVKGL